jgi:signal transduction histidine kinase
MPIRRRRPYDRDVASPATQQLAVRFAALPERRQEFITDAGIAVALSAVNAVSLLPYRSQLHPFWLALLLVIGQGVPLAWRRARPVGIGFLIGIARVGYDRLGFGFAPFPLGPAIAVFTVADLRGRGWRYVVAGLVLVGMTLSLTTPGHNEPYDAIFQVLIFATAWVAGVVSRTKRVNLAAAKHRADRAEAELDRQSSAAAAAERTRIARELHDVVAHHVSLIAVQAEAASSVLPDQPGPAVRSVAIISETARQALTELRRLLGVLRGPGTELEKAPAATLADLGPVLDQVAAAGLAVDLAVEGSVYPLAAGVDLTAYRIVQEALTNALRHSQASSAHVTLRYEPEFITVRVCDPGPGLGSQVGERIRGPASGGFGLAGIAERVASCGGSLSVGPAEPAGFTVTARLPAR